MIQHPSIDTTDSLRSRADALIPVILKVGSSSWGRMLNHEQAQAVIPEITALADKIKIQDPEGMTTGEWVAQALQPQAPQGDCFVIRNGALAGQR